MQRLQTQPNQTPRNLYNPTRDTFIFYYEGKNHVLPGLDTKPFPTYIADRMASSLADWIIAHDDRIKNRIDEKEKLLAIIKK